MGHSVPALGVGSVLEQGRLCCCRAGPRNAPATWDEMVEFGRTLTIRDDAGHDGLRGIHGPFFGLDLSNPDRDMRAIVQVRLIAGVEIAAALSADLMVVDSRFNYWHVLNYTKYANLRPALLDACADCLAPVLVRACEHGMTLALENIDDTAPGDRADLADMIDHPKLRLSVDTGKADLAHAKHGAPPVPESLAVTGTRLAHVHLQDVDGRIAWHPGMQALSDHPGNPRLLLAVCDRIDRRPATAAWLEQMLGHV